MSYDPVLPDEYFERHGPKKISIAIHEAAHGLFFHLLGFTGVTSRLPDDWEQQGANTKTGPRPNSRGEEGVAFLAGILAQRYAMTIDQRMAFPEDCFLKGWTEDLKEIKLAEDCGWLDQRKKNITLNGVVRLWPQICHLAKLLLDSGTLTDVEISHIAKGMDLQE